MTERTPDLSSANTTSWNFTTFEKFIDQRFGDFEKTINAAILAAEKAVDKSEAAQLLRNEAQNEFRKSLSDLSALMWTIKEGSAAVDSLRRELTLAVSNVSERANTLESHYSNLQGRMWAVSAVWAIVVLAASIGVRFLGH